MYHHQSSFSGTSNNFNQTGADIVPPASCQSHRQWEQNGLLHLYVFDMIGINNIFHIVPTHIVFVLLFLHYLMLFLEFEAVRS